MSQDTNHFVPRTLLKPTQLPPVSITKREVPEVSLVLDSTSIPKYSNSSELSNKINYGHYDNTEHKLKHTITNRLPDSNLNSSICQSTSRTQNELPTYRRTSSSPRRKMSDSEQLKNSIGDVHVSSIHSMDDHSVIDPDIFPEDYYPSLKLSTVYENNLSDHSFLPNDSCTNNKCHCIKSCKIEKNYCHLNGKKYVTMDEHQQVILKFENMLLKTNYKFTKIIENMSKKYDDRTEALTERLTLVENKLRDEMSLRTTTRHEKTVENNEHCCKVSSNSDNSTTKKTTSTGIQDPLRTSKTKKNNNENPHKNYPVHPVYNSSSTDSCELGTPKSRNEIKERHSFENKNHNQNHSIYRNDNLSYQENRRLSNEKYSSIERNTSNQINEEGLNGNEANTMAINGTEGVKNRTTVYDDGKRNIHNVLDENNCIGINSVDIIKKVTRNELRRIGLIDDSIDGNERRILPTSKVVSSNNKAIAHERQLPDNNTLTSSDLSAHMNTLAEKYIHNRNTKDENHSKRGMKYNFIERSNNDPDKSICNNVSTATLQYLDRYQLHQTNNKTKSIPLEDKSRQFQNKETWFSNHHDNNQSFIQ